MNTEIKKRILTSIFLFVLLIVVFLNNFILGFLLINISIFGFIEFTYISQKILVKKKILQFLINFLFILYISIFAILFFIFSIIGQFKIFLFFCLIICIFSDIGGYVIGKTFKGPKLTKFSPNKTISGSMGSFVFSSIISLIFIYYFDGTYRLFLLALFVSLSCQIGDIFFSYLKRKAKIKDTGKILPGHGGILDRIDGILVGIPLGLLLYLLFYSLVS
jgi:phosphatidate cytidylyltransferase